MGQKTGIAWTDHTFNMWWGCTEVSPACDNCYAREFAARYKWDVWGAGKPKRSFGEAHWRQLQNWDKAARRANTRRKVFVGSMMDWADVDAPSGELDKLWPIIRECKWLIFLMLTKRPGRARSLLPRDWSVENYPNVWLGTTVESNDYGHRTEALRQMPATHRFVSAEPLLGPLDQVSLDGISWVIVGGESGSHRRPMEDGWVQDILDRCLLGGTAFFYKQGVGPRPGMYPQFRGVTYHNFPPYLDGAEWAARVAAQAVPGQSGELLRS